MKARTASTWAALALVAPLLTGCGVIKNVHQGKKVGIVVGLAKQGYINQTWEGELALGNLRGGASGSSSTFDFHVDDPNVVAELQDAMNNLKPVEVTFDQTLGYNPWTRESDVTITDVVDLSGKISMLANPTLSQQESQSGGYPTAPIAPVSGGKNTNVEVLLCRPQ